MKERKIPDFARCSMCKNIQPESEFHRDWRFRNGLQSRCKSCAREAQRERRAKTEFDGESFLSAECRRCGTRKIYSEFDRSRDNRTGRSGVCKECTKTTKKKSRTRNRASYMISSAKSNALQRGIEFSIDESDISPLPETCPVLGIPLLFSDGRRNDNSFSIDRIDSSAGYVKGNVMVISWRANRMKAAMTIEEVEAILSYMKKRSP